MQAIKEVSVSLLLTTCIERSHCNPSDVSTIACLCRNGSMPMHFPPRHFWVPTSSHPDRMPHSRGGQLLRGLGVTMNTSLLLHNSQGRILARILWTWSRLSRLPLSSAQHLTSGLHRIHSRLVVTAFLSVGGFQRAHHTTRASSRTCRGFL
jgi:hypothetical protein